MIFVLFACRIEIVSTIAIKGNAAMRKRDERMNKKMTEKQYKKADAMVYTTLMVVMIGIFLNMLGMVSTGGGNTGMTLVTIASVVGVIVTIIGYRKLRGSRSCGIYMSVVATIVWGLMVLFVDAQFFYMLAAALFIAQMAYLEKKRIIISAFVIVPIFSIRSMMLANSGKVSLTEAGTSIVLLILIIVSVYNISKIWIVFNDENLDTVRRVSEELVTHFDEANKHIATLDQALNTSNLSMQEITTNIESTAFAIQNQSQRCLDIENNTQNAKAQTDIMVQASDNTLQEVARGIEVMDALHSHAQEVADDNQKTVAAVAELNERTRAVQNILSTITGISTQTHLLALNAMVEAARAGAAGKGFAVVADEIKSLAEQTKTATEDITTILTDLNQDVARVTTSIDHSVQITEEQNRLIEKSKGNFDAIDTEVSQLMNHIRDCKQVIDGITAASVIISDGITELSANSEEVAAAANDGTSVTARAVTDMNQVKATLTNIYELAQNLRNEYNMQ